MRSVAVVTAVCLSLAASIAVTAQQGPVLEPRLTFEVASIKVNTSRDRLPMQWQIGRGAVEVLVIDRLEMPTEN